MGQGFYLKRFSSCLDESAAAVPPWVHVHQAEDAAWKSRICEGFPSDWVGEHLCGHIAAQGLL